MTLLEFLLIGGTVELVVGGWVAGALSVGGWAYRKGLAEGRAEQPAETTVLPPREDS